MLETPAMAQDLPTVGAICNTAKQERDAIIAWLEDCLAVHQENSARKGQVTARRHHMDACENIIAAIKRCEHLLNP